jgi:hypothetical protein
MEDWVNAFKLVHEKDPYNHLRTIHNMLKFYDHSQPWVTHCSIQHQDIAQMTRWLKQYGKPVVIDFSRAQPKPPAF